MRMRPRWGRNGFRCWCWCSCARGSPSSSPSGKPSTLWNKLEPRRHKARHSIHILERPELRTHYWEDREAKNPAWFDSTISLLWGMRSATVLQLQPWAYFSPINIFPEYFLVGHHPIESFINWTSHIWLGAVGQYISHMHYDQIYNN